MTDGHPITQSELREKLDLHGLWLDSDHNEGVRLVLRNTKLDALDLSYADLNFAIFDRCSFVGSDMSHSNFSHSEFFECDFHDANMRGSFLVHINADKGVFNGVNLTGALIDFASLRNVSFVGATMEEVVCTNSVLIGANFRHVAELEGAQFVHCNLTRSDFTGVDISDTKFVQSVVIECVFDGANIDFMSSIVVGEILRQTARNDRSDDNKAIALKAMTSNYLKKSPLDPSIYNDGEYKWVTSIMKKYGRELVGV